MALAGGAAFYLVSQEWFSWIVFFILIFLPWFSLLFSFRAMLNTKLQLSAPERVQMEMSAGCRVNAVSPLPLPPYRCKVQVTDPNGQKRFVLSLKEDLPTEHCGGLVLTPHSAKVYDYLGLFAKKIRPNESIKVCVMPKPVKFKIPSELTRNLSQAGQKPRNSGYGEEHELRPYQPGDKLNRVHWKLSHKVNDLMVRDFLASGGDPLLISLRLNGSPEELDEKMGKLLWFGSLLAEQGVIFEVMALTGKGTERKTVRSLQELNDCIAALLHSPFAPESAPPQEDNRSSLLRYDIGGEKDEE